MAGRFIKVPCEREGKRFNAHVNVDRIIYVYDHRIYFEAGKFVPTLLTAEQVRKLIDECDE